MLLFVPAPSSATRMAARSAGGISFLFALSVLSASATTPGRSDPSLKPVLAETGFGVKFCFGPLGGPSSPPSARGSSGQHGTASCASWPARRAPLRAASKVAAAFLAVWAEIFFGAGGGPIVAPGIWDRNETIAGLELAYPDVFWSPSWASVDPDLARAPLRHWERGEGGDLLDAPKGAPRVFLASGVLRACSTCSSRLPAWRSSPPPGGSSPFPPVAAAAVPPLGRCMRPWGAWPWSSGSRLPRAPPLWEWEWSSWPSSSSAGVARRPFCSDPRPPSPARGVGEGGAGFRWARDQPLADQRWASAAAAELVSSSPCSVLDGATVPVPDGQPLAGAPAHNGRHATERGRKRTRKGGVARVCLGRCKLAC